MSILKKIFWISFNYSLLLFAETEVGLDLLFKGGVHPLVKGKKIGLITNHTAINRKGEVSYEVFFRHSKETKLVALFAPEHGLRGDLRANDLVPEETLKGIPVYSLFGNLRRPTQEMLKGIDLLVYDIQDVGVRPYTYMTTLFYVMEEAAKASIPILVLDRPNPISGLTVDGPMLQEKFRSFIGYINIPYIYGMTIAELADFFNQQYKVGVKLHVIPMAGWKRSMTFRDTGLSWIPTSPNIPEPETAFFFGTTGLLGELSLCDIGIGTTLPFKVIGASWLDGELVAMHLNRQKLPGVYFHPFHYQSKKESYKGILIDIRNKQLYRPFLVQAVMMGVLKTLYPEKIKSTLNGKERLKKELFCKAAGSDQILNFLQLDRYVGWKIAELDEKERLLFLETRKKYLRPEYEETE